MKCGVVNIPDDHAYILVIGDLHMGDKAFGKESRRKLDGYLKWVQDHPNARIFLNGDMVNTATRDSKSSPFEQDQTLEEQVNKVADIFRPVKDQIIGAVMGNHERRIVDFAGFDPTISILSLMGCDVQNIYYKHCAVLKVGVGKRSERDGPKHAYTMVFHHTTGGGGTTGAKINRVEKMRSSTVSNADVYCGSHNHNLIASIQVSNEFNPYNNSFTPRKQTFVSCGGYLEWNNSYAEAMQLPPAKLGSPRIRLEGKKDEKDVHISL